MGRPRKPLTEIPNQIRALRDLRGLSIEALAERVGLSVSFTQRIETGGRPLSSKHMAKFARALNCEIGDLFSPHPPLTLVLLDLWRHIPENRKLLAIDVLRPFAAVENTGLIEPDLLDEDGLRPAASTLGEHKTK